MLSTGHQVYVLHLRFAKMDRHHQSAMEVLIIAIANRRSVDADTIEQELCAAMGVETIDQVDPLEAQAWLGEHLTE